MQSVRRKRDRALQGARTPPTPHRRVRLHILLGPNAAYRKLRSRTTLSAWPPCRTCGCRLPGRMHSRGRRF
jgi:hypothetical protein